MNAPRRRPRPVTGPASLAALTSAAQDARSRALEAISRMRISRLSLSAAARASGTTPRTVRRYAAGALVQTGRRTTAAPTDRLYRRMAVLGADGARHDVDVRSSAQASRVAAHWNAVDRYLCTGDTTALNPFRNHKVGGQQLATDPTALEAFARRGELAIESIYAYR